MSYIGITHNNKGELDQLQWSNPDMQGSSPTDSKTYLVLVTCYNTLTAAVLKTVVNMLDLLWCIKR